MTYRLKFLYLRSIVDYLKVVEGQLFLEYIEALPFDKLEFKLNKYLKRSSSN